MKALNVVFWIAVAGVGVSFAGAVRHSIVEKRTTTSTNPATIPTPAVLPNH